MPTSNASPPWAGADGYLSKPLDFAVLQNLLAQISDNVSEIAA